MLKERKRKGFVHLFLDYLEVFIDNKTWRDARLLEYHNFATLFTSLDHFMSRVVFECNKYHPLYNLTAPQNCPSDLYLCCNQFCCIINRNHRELWETWYFWFGVVLIFLFVFTSAISYVITSCKRKQHTLIRIRNIATPAGVPVISTISGPEGIIQPHVQYKKQLSSSVQATAIIAEDIIVEDFAGPLDPPYPSVQPVTIVRGTVPAQGYRQTLRYTELVLPPGFVDTENCKQPG